MIEAINQKLNFDLMRVFSCFFLLFVPSYFVFLEGFHGCLEGFFVELGQVFSFFVLSGWRLGRAWFPLAESHRSHFDHWDCNLLDTDVRVL